MWLLAGGQGGLTYELQVVHGVRCTLVEPRPFKLSRFQARQLKKEAKKERLWRQQQQDQGQDGDKPDPGLSPGPSQQQQQQQQQQQHEEDALREDALREDAEGSGCDDEIIAGNASRDDSLPGWEQVGKTDGFMAGPTLLH